LSVVRQEEGESDEDWTRRIERAIADDLGVQVTEFTAAHKLELERQMLPLETQLRLFGVGYVANRLTQVYPTLSLDLIRSEIGKLEDKLV